MNIGMQLIVPHGYRSLLPGVRYYFLANNRRDGLVNLVFYSKTKTKYSTNLISISSVDFGYGLTSGLIRADENQLDMPPWMYECADGVLLKNKNWIGYAREKHKGLVGERLKKIEPLLDKVSEICRSEKPVRYINDLVNESGGKLNYGRVKNWFFAYVLHGNSCDALLPKFHRNGSHAGDTGIKKWIRVGRKSKRIGKKGGFVSSSELITKIIEGFVRHAEIGRPMTKIYSIAIAKEFGCKTFENPATGLTEYYHPEGEPYPTFWQFKYRVSKEFSPHAIAMKIYGPKRAKAILKADIGSFTENVGNLMERVEFDAYYLKERPRSFLGKEYLTRLCVVRAVDVLSGAIVGVGFSIDTEVAEAYKMCLFSMAMNKVEFCRLFGIEIGAKDWPFSGMSAMEVYDRGPAIKLLQERVDRNMVMVELTPSYSGQSKAIVEASHPRDMKDQESPFFRASHLDFIQMVKREIFRVLLDNKTSDVSSRITPEMVRAKVPPFPLAVWNYMESRGRTDAFPMKLEDAVKSFLVKVDVKINRKGAFLNGQHYHSAAFSETGIFDKAAKGQQLTLTGYVMTACVREIWVSLNGRLYQITAQLSINDDENQLYVSLEDLKDIESKRKEMNSAVRDHQLAGTTGAYSNFESQVGIPWNASDLIQGRPVKSVQAQKEIADIKKIGRS